MLFSASEKGKHATARFWFKTEKYHNINRMCMKSICTNGHGSNRKLLGTAVFNSFFFSHVDPQPNSKVGREAGRPAGRQTDRKYSLEKALSLHEIIQPLGYTTTRKALGSGSRNVGPEEQMVFRSFFADSIAA